MALGLALGMGGLMCAVGGVLSRLLNNGLEPVAVEALVASGRPDEVDPLGDSLMTLGLTCLSLF
jgi:hypothetical protein